MINPKELRIGNILCDNETYDFVTVHEINGDYIKEMGFMLLGIPSARYTPENIDAIEPVELDEYWLKRIGFIKDRCGWNLPKTQFSLTDKFYPCWLDRMLWPQDIPDFKHLSLKYVHQMQNLFYFLTMGEELTIKEKTA